MYKRQAPKFIDLTGDARTATMQGLEGSLNSGSGGIYAKALIASATASTATVTIAGETYNLVYGFPAARGVGSVEGLGTSVAAYGIAKAIEISESMNVSVAEAGGVATFTRIGAPDEATCKVTYAQPTVSGQVPKVTSEVGGC